MGTLAGKVAVVTGATSGVGFETSVGLARLGAHVVMTARDDARGRAALGRLRERVPEASVEVAHLDLASFASVRRFADAVLRDHRRLDVLVNNAGIHTARRRETEDGHELTWQTNHLGPSLLTARLLPRLSATGGARVVFVASEAHRGGRIKWDDLERARRWSGIGAYTQSKLANIMTAFALARRVAPEAVAVNATHPGSVRSGWARGADSGLFRLAVWASTPFLVSPEKGARTPLRAAAAPELAGVTGAYFVRGRPKAPTRAARDEAAQERLARLTEEAVGARFIAM